MNIIPTGFPGFAAQAGIPLSLYPGDAAYTLELQRAPDNGSGAPNTGAAVTSAQGIPGTQPVYVDPLPADGTLYWYQARHTGYGDTASSWTGWVGPFKAIVIPDGVQRAAPIAPVVALAKSQTATDGTLTLTITDPQSRVTLVEFQTTAGAGGSPSGWTTDSTIPYATTVALNGDVGVIEYRVTGYDASGVLRVLAQEAVRFTFSPGTITLPALVITKVDSTHFTVDISSAPTVPSGTTFEASWSVDGGDSGSFTGKGYPADFPVSVTVTTALGAAPTGKVTLYAVLDGRTLAQRVKNGAFAL